MDFFELVRVVKLATVVKWAQTEVLKQAEWVAQVKIFKLAEFVQLDKMQKLVELFYWSNGSKLAETIQVDRTY